MKKVALILTMLLLAAMAIMPASALAADRPLEHYFVEDIEGHWAQDEIDDLINADILYGYVDAEGTVTFKPNQTITRAEFVAILVRALGLSGGSQAQRFDDVQSDKWYYDAVQTAASHGIVKGVSERQFAPNKQIRRDEIAVMVANAFENSIKFEGQAKTFRDVPDYWGKPYIEKVSRVGIISGYNDGTFKPAAKATRAEAVTMLHRALQLENSNLPDEKMLTEKVIHDEMEGLALFNQGDLDKLAEHNEESLTGYYKAMANSTLEEYKALFEEGYSVKMTLKGQLSAHVVQRSDRFAAVALDGAVYEVEVTGDGDTQKFETDSSGIVLLRKMPGENVWKTYMYLENNSEDNDDPNGNNQ